MKQLLLLHGAIGAKDQLEPLAQALNGNFIVHTFNFSGHGGESIPDSFSIQLFADDVLRYLTQNSIDQISIFGYSMGGYVALYLARQHPGKVESVFTLATKFDWTPQVAMRETKMVDSEKISEKIPNFAKQLELRHNPQNWKVVLSKTVDMMQALGENNPLKLDDFKTIQQNILIGIGDKDSMVSLEESISVFRMLPAANLIVFPNMQHPIEKVDIKRISSEIVMFFQS